MSSIPIKPKRKEIMGTYNAYSTWSTNLEIISNIEIKLTLITYPNWRLVEPLLELKLSSLSSSSLVQYGTLQMNKNCMGIGPTSSVILQGYKQWVQCEMI